MIRMPSSVLGSFTRDLLFTTTRFWTMWMVLGELFPNLTVGNSYTKIPNDVGKIHVGIKTSRDVANSNIRIYNT